MKRFTHPPLRNLALAGLVLLGGTAAKAYDFEVDGLYYNITNSSTLTVEVTIWNNLYGGYDGDIVVPSTVKNSKTYTVTGLGAGAFYHCMLSSITIPETVTYLGDSSLGYCYMTTCDLPSGLTDIGGGAFAGCTKLTSLTIPDGVTSIGRCAFQYCTALTSINIPDGITTIGDYMFYGCTSLPGLTIPDAVTTIGEYAFYNCTSLTSITIPDAVTTIGDKAFQKCTGLTSVTLGENLDSIGDFSFQSCTALKNIYCYDPTPAVLDEDAFSGVTCDDITLHVLPGCAEAYKAAAYWSNFTNVVEDMPFRVDGIYYNITDKDNKTVEVTNNGQYNTYSGSVSVPGRVTYNGTDYSVTAVGHSAFRSCTDLTSVTVGEGVAVIDTAAFHYSTNLKSVSLPNTLTSIEESGFYFCKSLTSITIPDAVATIGYDAFCGCDKMTSLYLGEGLSFADDFAFSATTSLTNIYSYAQTPGTLTQHAFNGNAFTDATLHVLPGCAEAYKAAAYWSNFNNIVEDITVSSFHADGVYYNVSDKDNKNVTVTYKNTSYNSYSGDVTVPQTVTKYGTTYRVTAVGPRAFRESSELKSVVLPEGITSIGANAFRFCSNMESVNIPDGVASIDSFAFYVCSSLTAIDIPNSVTTLGNNVFSRCTGLQKATVGKGITRIPNYFFNRCNSLTDVNIPNQVTSLGKGAFNQCYSLTRIGIPGSVTDIGEIAFAECKALTDVYCYGTAPATLAGNSFDDSTCGSATLHVPEGSTSAYKAAAYWSNFYSFEELDAGTTGIGEVDSAAGTAAAKAACFSLDGRRLSALRKGVNIVRGSDGSVKKILVK